MVAVHDATGDLAAEAAARQAATVLVVSSPHRLSHPVHRDLEHRLRHAGVARVVRVEPMSPSPAPSMAAPSI